MLVDKAVKEIVKVLVVSNAILLYVFHIIVKSTQF